MIILRTELGPWTGYAAALNILVFSRPFIIYIFTIFFKRVASTVAEYLLQPYLWRLGSQNWQAVFLCVYPIFGGGGQSMLNPIFSWLYNNSG